MRNKEITKIAFSALFTSLICLLSQISFVTPAVPLTLQTLGVALCGFALGVKYSAACIVTYLAVGSLGLPVFSAFQGGFQIMLGPGGGFLWGFLILSVSCAWGKKIGKAWSLAALPFAGLAACHALGVLQYSLVTGNSVWISFLTVSLPFCLKDIFCIIAAYYLINTVKKRINGFDF